MGINLLSVIVLISALSGQVLLGVAPENESISSNAAVTQPNANVPEPPLNPPSPIPSAPHAEIPLKEEPKLTESWIKKGTQKTKAAMGSIFDGMVSAFDVFAHTATYGAQEIEAKYLIKYPYNFLVLALTSVLALSLTLRILGSFTHRHVVFGALSTMIGKCPGKAGGHY